MKNYDFFFISLSFRIFVVFFHHNFQYFQIKNRQTKKFLGIRDVGVSSGVRLTFNRESKLAIKKNFTYEKDEDSIFGSI